MAGPNKTAPADSIEESYPLSPMQEGMVFNGFPTRHPGVEIGQVICTLPEEFNGAVFRETWECLVEWHAVLRTGFGGEGLGARQEFHRRVRLDFELNDWPGLTDCER